MNTHAYPRLVRHGLVAAALGLSSLIVHALPPQAEDAADPVVADPYLELLSALGQDYPHTLSALATVRGRLLAQAEWTEGWLAADEPSRTALLPRLDALAAEARDAEAAFFTQLEQVTVLERPRNKQMVPTDRKARRAFFRGRQIVYPPIPDSPLDLPAVEAPAREKMALVYLAIRAGDDELTKSFVAKSAEMLERRRDLSLRYLRGDAITRSQLVATISLVSYGLRQSERQILERDRTADRP